MIYYELGCHCHWCGEKLQHAGNVRRGNHLFCRNKGRCRQAHYRAYHAYLKSQNRVTSTSGESDVEELQEIEECNAKRGAHGQTMPPALRRIRIRKRNARKRGKT